MAIDWNVISGPAQQKSGVIDQGKLQEAQTPLQTPDTGSGWSSADTAGLKAAISGKQPTPYSNPDVGTGLSNSIPGQTQAAQQSGLQGALQQATTMGNPQPLTSDLANSPAFTTAKQAHDAAVQSGVTSSPIMTVVDFSKPANQPRMFVVDTAKNQVLGSTYVAQGSTPGFSNTPESHQSSLGTYLTGDTYHSNSMNKDAMRIQGLDKGVNDNAFARGIVVHGGSYVGPDKQGTSWGCFAVPNGVAPSLIGLTKGGTIIHAYAPDSQAVSKFGTTLTPQGQANLHSTINQGQGQQDWVNTDSKNLQNGSAVGNTQQWIKTDSQNLKNGSAVGNTQPLTDYAKQYNNPQLPHIMSAIAQNESGGAKDPYNAVTNAGGGKGHAIGKYQIMDFNIPSWTHEALGHPMTAQQFKANPQAQEDTAAYMMNKYSQKYGPEGTAGAWLGGEGGRNNNKAKDNTGTSVGDYKKSFNKHFLASQQHLSENTSRNEVDPDDEGNMQEDGNSNMKLPLDGVVHQPANINKMAPNPDINFDFKDPKIGTVMEAANRSYFSNKGQLAMNGRKVDDDDDSSDDEATKPNDENMTPQKAGSGQDEDVNDMIRRGVPNSGRYQTPSIQDGPNSSYGRIKPSSTMAMNTRSPVTAPASPNSRVYDRNVPIRDLTPAERGKLMKVGDNGNETSSPWMTG